MTTVVLNEDALVAMERIVAARAIPASANERVNDLAREKVRSNAVEFFNAVMKANPELGESK